MVIHNESDLRNAYEYVALMKKLKSEHPEIVSEIDEILKSMKIAIRKYYRKQANRPEIRYFDSENAGYYRVFGETDYNSVAEAEELHEPITCYPDQLGRWFEISHKFFKRSDGKVCGYAWMAMNW